MADTTTTMEAPVATATVGTGAGGSPTSGTQTVTVGQTTVPQGTGGSTVSNPYTLTGTQITDISTPLLALSARVHRKAADQFNDCELWYWRDNAWHIMPAALFMDERRCPRLTYTYRQPSSLEVTLQNAQGEFTPENQLSPYNRNANGDYDALIDEARKILFRVGCRCYSDIAAGIAPTSTLAPSSGSLSNLTDQTLQNYTQAIAGGAQWTPATLAPFDIQVDLGSPQWVRHMLLRCGTRKGVCVLPGSVQAQLSQDGVHWSALPASPVGGNGSGSVTPGDWDEDPNGRGIEVVRCDIEMLARYVKWTVTPYQVGAGTTTLAIDEICVYGGQQAQMLGRNMLVGYMGDNIDLGNEGEIKAVVTDSMKRLADNNEAGLTATYRNAETADIVYDLLSAPGYWTDESDYNAPFQPTEIGWPRGSKLTGLVYPLWQSHTNNLLGYTMEMFHSVGWVFLSDGNGVWQAFEPPYKQRLPDRLLTNADDGNRDARQIVRKRTGKELRNKVQVRCGKTSDGTSGSNLAFEPNSVRRYGPRRNIITDPLASTDELRAKISQYVLRDYAYRLSSLHAEIAPDYDTRLCDIHAFRAPYRAKLFARYSGDPAWLRAGELWSLRALTQTISVGAWNGEADYIPYNAGVIEPPIVSKLEAPSGQNFVRVDYSPQDFWSAYDFPATYNVYMSTTSESGPWTLVGHPAVLAGAGSYDLGVVTGTSVWVYMTSVQSDGRESLPSQVVTCLSGSGSVDDGSGWVVTDLGASLSENAGPDAQGYYTYGITVLWTSPSPKGYKRMTVRMSPNVLPSNPDPWSSWPEANNTWNQGTNGQIVPPGLMWDRVTAGQLNWECRWRTKTPVPAGARLYIRMWTSNANTSFHPTHPGGWAGYPSNITYVQF